MYLNKYVPRAKFASHKRFILEGNMFLYIFLLLLSNVVTSDKTFLKLQGKKFSTKTGISNSVFSKPSPKKLLTKKSLINLLQGKTSIVNTSTMVKATATSNIFLQKPIDTSTLNTLIQEPRITPSSKVFTQLKVPSLHNIGMKEKNTIERTPLSESLLEVNNIEENMADQKKVSNRLSDKANIPEISREVQEPSLLLSNSKIKIISREAITSSKLINSTSKIILAKNNSMVNESQNRLSNSSKAKANAFVAKKSEDTYRPRRGRSRIARSRPRSRPRPRPRSRPRPRVNRYSRTRTRTRIRQGPRRVKKKIIHVHQNSGRKSVSDNVASVAKTAIAAHTLTTLLKPNPIYRRPVYNPGYVPRYHGYVAPVAPVAPAQVAPAQVAPVPVAPVPVAPGPQVGLYPDGTFVEYSHTEPSNGHATVMSVLGGLCCLAICCYFIGRRIQGEGSDDYEDE